MEEHKSYISKGGGEQKELIDLASHGIYFARGGAIELLTLPPTIGEEVNDWQEENGLEIDLHQRDKSCPFINLRFVVMGQTREEFLRRLDFFRSLMDSYFLVLYPAGMQGKPFNGAFHIDRITIEGYRHIGRPLYLSGAKAGEVTIRCRQKSFWQRGSTLDEYTPEPMPLSRVMLGNTDFANMGIQVQEVYDTLLQPASFKAYTYKEQSREVAIKCLSVANTYEDLGANIAICEKQMIHKQFYLTYGGGRRVRCYYTSMTDVRELQLSSRKGITFTLNFKTT